MASIYALKPAFQSLLRPITWRMAASGITANQVTVAALALSLVQGLPLAALSEQRWPLLLLPLTLLLRMALNAIDGMLAREHHMKSALGAVLNELGDVISDTALYLPFALIPGVSGAAVVLIVVLAAVSEMTGVVAVQIGASRRYDGPLGKSDRAFLFGALGLLLGMGAAPGLWLDALLWLAVVLLALTIFNRARNALEEATR